MVILTTKLTKGKRLLILALILIAVIVLTVCVRGANKGGEAAAEAETQTARTAKTEEDRLAYLSALGWQVEESPVQTQQVRVPTEPNDVFLRYNALQKSQGFDLSEFAGKTIHRYVYKITNYPGAESESWLVTLLVYKDEVIGGDVSSASKNGVMHSLSRPQGS